MTRTVRAALLAAGLVLGATANPATAGAADICADLAGTVDQDGLCRLKEENPNYTLAMSFPVDFPDQGAVDDFVGQTRTGFLNETNTPTFSGVPYSLEMQATPWASDSTRSVSFEIYENLGGAHPNTWYQTFNYDTERRSAIAFGDLFAPGVNPLTAIFPIVQRNLEAEMGMPTPVSEEDGMDPSHYRNFAITPTNLVFFFDRGELMAGAAGAHTVYVPRNAIPPLAV